jgi:DNA-binding MarR family transcriptional regulator
MEEMAYVFGTIFTLSNRLQALGDRMDERLTVKQWLFLAGVVQCGPGAPTLSQVAKRIGTSRQNAKKIAAILERQRFIRIERDARDARALQISLTDACMERLSQRAEMEKRFLGELFSGFGPGEMSAFAGALKKLEKNVEEMGRGIEDEV